MSVSACSFSWCACTVKGNMTSKHDITERYAVDRDSLLLSSCSICSPVDPNPGTLQFISLGHLFMSVYSLVTLPLDPCSPFDQVYFPHFHSLIVQLQSLNLCWCACVRARMCVRVRGCVCTCAYLCMLCIAMHILCVCVHMCTCLCDVYIQQS